MLVMEWPLLLLAFACSSSALVIQKRSACSSYTLINTRGTSEPQGESAGFLTINQNVQSQVSGGSVYNTVYPASWDQDSSAGTTDIVNHIESALSSNPSECFILQGYSQGAAATVIALSKITGSAADAVKGVFLIGNPMHKSGLSCNVDNKGGDTTANVNGMAAFFGGVPSSWVSKTMDVCIYGDGVCDTTHGVGIDQQHLEYPMDSSTHDLGTKWIVEKLQG